MNDDAGAAIDPVAAGTSYGVCCLVRRGEGAKVALAAESFSDRPEGWMHNRARAGAAAVRTPQAFGTRPTAHDVGRDAGNDYLELALPGVDESGCPGERPAQSPIQAIPGGEV